MAKHDIDRVARAPREKITAGFVKDAELGRALRSMADAKLNREPRERMTAARARLETSHTELERALMDVSAVPVLATHPIMEELRDAVLAGKKMLARANDILKRMP